MRALGLAVLAAFLCGCDSYHYHAGRFLEARRQLPAALEHYEAFLRARPRDERAPELHVRAGGVYARLQQCLEARRHYEAAARQFPDATPWTQMAKAGIVRCPDYFPLEPGRTWSYGDSASGGQAMRLEWEARASTQIARGLIVGSLYAGSRKLSETRTAYDVSEWAVWQSDAEGRGALLRFPFAPGSNWTVQRGGRELAYRIESADAQVDVAAGRFKDCLKVRETTKGFSESWKYDYYCPFIGRVLTSVAGPGFENPNTELLRYSGNDLVKPP